MTDDDLAAVAAILNREIRESAYVYADTPVTLDERHGWWKTHQAAALPVLVATEADSPNEVLGWGALSAYRPSGGYRHTAEVSVYVDRRAHRRGIARALVTALHDLATRDGVTSIVASIDSENWASIALFESLGYRESARLPEVGWKFDRRRTQLLFLRAL